jgi:AraC-like DNA-binding protein/mannose-6-phosphate isomerase-like protein (cupin superfamily)
VTLLKERSFQIDVNLKEITKHRTETLPIACYETTIRENINGYIPLHWHEEIQLVVVLKGEAIFQINENKRAVKEGNALFINSGCLHMAEEKKQSNCVYICLNVLPHLFLSQELYTTYGYPYVKAPHLSYIFIDRTKGWGKSIIESILKVNELLNEKAPFFEIDIATQLTMLWKNLVSHAFQQTHPKTNTLKNERMKRMLNWIHENYKEKITLDDIARSGQLSRSECCRYFKRILHTTPISYITEYRVQKSLLLLLEEEASVTNVAYAVGFNSTSYFIDQFKKVMKITPFVYQQERRGKS